MCDTLAFIINSINRLWYRTTVLSECRKKYGAVGGDFLTQVLEKALHAYSHCSEVD